VQATRCHWHWNISGNLPVRLYQERNHLFAENALDFALASEDIFCIITDPEDRHKKAEMERFSCNPE
jgi:hypothetical protein